MSKFKIIGTSVPRLDGAPKTNGKALYVADLPSSDVWLGGTVRSAIPYGKIISVTKDPSFDWSSVTVVEPDDIPGTPYVHIVRDDYPALALDTVNYVTQPIALVAAPNKNTLERALKSITVEYEPFDPVLTIDDSLQKTAVIWGKDNLLDEYRVHIGDVNQGFEEADHIIEEVYETGLQEQMYLETQGILASPLPGGGIEITGSMQCPYYVLGGVAAALNLPMDKLRVRLLEVGGAFGGKEDYPTILAAHAALLAQKSGYPVRMIYDRSEDMNTSPKRHPSRVYHKTGFKNDGTLTAVSIDLIMDGGAYTTLSRVILQRAVLHTTCAYKVQNADIRGRAIATNTPPTGAFRGFGAPQAIFAMERQMDKVAAFLDMNPLDIRLKNLMQAGDSFPYKQVMQEGLGAKEVLTRVAEISDYRRKHAQYAAAPSERIRRGIGISVALHGGGFTGSGEDNMNTTVKIIYKNGVFELLTSCVDMGQGSSTVLPMIAAERLGIPIENVRHPFADTWTAPNSGPTVASRSTMFVGKVVDQACVRLIEKLKDFLARKKQCPASDILFSEGCFVAPDSTFSLLELACLFAEQEELSIQCVYESKPVTNPWNDEKFEGTAYKGYAWIAQAVEVEVDMDTYEVHPIDCYIVAETGRTINPTLATGQLEGGLLQGLGWAHIENLEITPDGRYSAEHMNAYLVPTSLDAPRFHVEMLEIPCEAGPFGAKGIGELPANGGAPAFLAAIQNATGIFGAHIPLTGERLFTLMQSPIKEGARHEG